MAECSSKKKIVILGSTGSIGTQSLEVADKLKSQIEVTGMSAGNNIELFTRQIEKFHPEYVSVAKKEDAQFLQKKFPSTKVYFGEQGINELACLDCADEILVAVSGKIGLRPTVNAIKKKKNIALANKETLVTAGDYVIELAKENGVKILPVDSEHSALFQCMNGQKRPKKLIITASGGPFRTSTKDEMENADLHSALAHPRWNMGRKITVDSATLMNKGLEVIEAHHLFNFDYDDIKVVIHPQSYIHSAVEFEDGSIIAQIGVPSMHIPIQYALTYPDRVEGPESESFDFTKAVKFEFYEPDFEKFPSLKLAIEAGKTGGTAAVCMNAANEEAVFAFLNKKIGFCDIYKITKKVYDSYSPVFNADIDTIINEDETVRNVTRELIEKEGK